MIVSSESRISRAFESRLTCTGNGLRQRLGPASRHSCSSGYIGSRVFPRLRLFALMLVYTMYVARSWELDIHPRY